MVEGGCRASERERESTRRVMYLCGCGCSGTRGPNATCGSVAIDDACGRRCAVHACVSWKRKRHTQRQRHIHRVPAVATFIHDCRQRLRRRAHQHADAQASADAPATRGVRGAPSRGGGVGRERVMRSVSPKSKRWLCCRICKHGCMCQSMDALEYQVDTAVAPLTRPAPPPPHRTDSGPRHGT